MNETETTLQLTRAEARRKVAELQAEGTLLGCPECGAPPIMWSNESAREYQLYCYNALRKHDGKDTSTPVADSKDEARATWNEMCLDASPIPDCFDVANAVRLLFALPDRFDAHSFFRYGSYLRLCWINQCEAGGESDIGEWPFDDKEGFAVACVAAWLTAKTGKRVDIVEG